jgi:hypothetical protein
MNFKKYLEEKELFVKAKNIENPGYYDEEGNLYNGKVFSSGYLDLNASHVGDKPYTFEVGDEVPDFDLSYFTGRKAKEGRIGKINLIMYIDRNTKLNKFNWIKKPKIKNQIGKSLISVDYGSHFYCLEFEFNRSFGLIYDPKGRSEPRSKPHFRGNLSFGKVIGEVEMLPSRKLHPVYDKITLN